MRVRGGVPGEQLHGAGVGQVQRLVPGLQSQGPAQEGLAHHPAAAGGPLHEAGPQGPRGPDGGVPLHARRQAYAASPPAKSQEELID